MKFGSETLELDDIDLGILAELQRNCRQSLAKIASVVGLSAPSVNERVRKLEDGGVITGYHAMLDSRKLELDVAAFIGVAIAHPRGIELFEEEVEAIDDVLECHHVTGQHTLLLKVKTRDTASLESLIRRLRSIEGVQRTETMVVLSTHSERVSLGLGLSPGTGSTRRTRRNGERAAAQTG